MFVSLANTPISLEFSNSARKAILIDFSSATDVYKMSFVFKYEEEWNFSIRDVQLGWSLKIRNRW